MPTVAELRHQAKEAGIRGYSKMVKAELETALDLPVTGKPRKESELKTPYAVRKMIANATGRPMTRDAPKAPPKPTYATNDVVVLFEVQAIDGEVRSLRHVIPANKIGSLTKLRDEIATPMHEREMVGTEGEEESYIETLFKHSVRDDEEEASDYDSKPEQRVIFTAAVLMF